MPTLNTILNTPLSLYSIPVMYIMTFYPHTMKFLSIDKLVGFNNTLPRSNNPKNLTGKVPAKTLVHWQRLEGAHQNGNEANPLWMAAVLAGNFAGLETRWLNIMAASYLASRLGYNFTYIYFNNVANGWLRTVLFFSGLSIPLRILFKAAGVVANK
ncbi:hypothetical protein D9619_007856 [Psilocybe cf. subviscida]|uniref:MAPEG family protein n=1 Tax=Psilocybe cf. subviscida TaxID=2480587 RepID=A0A8H5AU10_9AGAR|nr:hypothetical protein D9619_007856 [Psilocybe cf. subviscida]